MSRKQQVTTIVIVTAVIAALVLTVWLAISPNLGPTIRVTDIAFLETAGPPLSFASSPNSLLASFQPTQTQQIQTVPPLAMRMLPDERVLLLMYPEKLFFDLDGNILSRETLNLPSDELLQSEGFESSDFDWLETNLSAWDFTITDSERIWGLFFDEPAAGQTKDPGFLIQWNPDGEPVSVLEIGPLFIPLIYLDTNSPLEWWIDSEGENVLVSSSNGGFLLLEPNSEPVVTAIEFIANMNHNGKFHLYEDSVFDRGMNIRPTKYFFSGAIDWKWVQSTSPLFQRTPASTQFFQYGQVPGLAFLEDGRILIPKPAGIAEIDPDSGQITILGDASTAVNFRDEMMKFFTGLAEGFKTEDGWLFLPISETRQVFGQSISGFTTDDDFNITGTRMFTATPPEPDEIESDESTPPTTQLLEVGDIAYPDLVSRDLHPTPAGFRIIDNSLRRILVTDENLTIESILDWTAPSTGRYMNIQVCRVDSRGVYYLLGHVSSVRPGMGSNAVSFIQVLDSDGSYIRGHDLLGEDLFGTAIQPSDLLIDELDRLWVLSADRFFVIDREGNLTKIYERRGAPYTRVAPPTLPGPPTYDTPRGYTIVTSTDPFITGPSPESPVVLNAGEFSDLVVGRGNARMLFYVVDTPSEQVVAYDWSGNERGSIDLSEVLSGVEYQVMTGPDGYFYLLDPNAGVLFVYDPMLEDSHEIKIPGLQGGSWMPPTLSDPGIRNNSNKCWINEDGELVVFLQRSNDLLVYTIREDAGETQDVPGLQESVD